MNIVFVQAALPDYRESLLTELFNRLDNQFQVFVGSEYFDSTTKTSVPSGQLVTIIPNCFLFGRRLLYQHSAIWPAITASYAILELNPRILSNWIILLVRQHQRKPTVLFGHALSRRGKDNIWRKLFRHLGDVILVYTEQECEYFRHIYGKDKPVIAACNSIYRQPDMQVVGNEKSRKNFIYVGRLVIDKKPGILLEAFARAASQLPEDARLIIVGDGPLYSELKQRSIQLGIEPRCELLGHIADFRTLRNLYATSIASISPGYVGLSITQSLGFGIPMLIANHEPHAPEIEAALAGVNCQFFESDNPDSLASAMVQTSRNSDEWVAKSAEIVRICKENYSIEKMASRIIESINLAQALR